MLHPDQYRETPLRSRIEFMEPALRELPRHCRPYA
jgi:hypothetical protein